MEVLRRRFYTILILIIVFQMVFANSNLDEGIKKLARDLAPKIGEGKKVAVVEFSNMNGAITDLGKFLAEELVTELLNLSERKFEVIERRLLIRVLEEQKIAIEDLFEANSIKKLGKLVGVDFLVTGTTTDLGNEVRINARIISTETAGVIAASRADVPNVGTVERLLKKTSNATTDRLSKSGIDGDMEITTSKAPNNPQTTPDNLANSSPILATEQVLIADRIAVSSSWGGYGIERAFDRSPATEWSSGVGNLAIGQWVELTFRQPQNITAIEIYNPENNPYPRLKLATLFFSDGTNQQIKFQGFNGWDKVGIESFSTGHFF